MSAPPSARAPARPALSSPSSAEPIHARRWVLASFTALIALGVAWEFWLAPLRPGGSLLALKVLPLVFATGVQVGTVAMSRPLSTSWS